jgi:hypothetical protein
MDKGECARCVTPLHSAEGSQESLPYRHGGCSVALEDTVTFFHVVLGYSCGRWSDLAAFGKAQGSGTLVVMLPNS